MPRKNAAEKAVAKVQQNGTAPAISNGTVKTPLRNGHRAEERPSKRAKLLDDSDEEEEKEEADFAPLNGDIKLNINEEYARRFEHNKKREERHRLEEKYGKDVATTKRAREENDDDYEESSTDESEDDDGLLGPADEEFQATLQALRKKDPRIYDKTAKFYTERDGDGEEDADGEDVKKEKPMTLKDYHRKNLLERNFGDDEDKDAPPTYAQEQEALKNGLVATVHAADDTDEDDDDFLTRKPAPEPDTTTKVEITEADVAAADKDPETFLSNFLSSRAWETAAKDRFTALESDDSEEEARAEKFEEMYNMRFEDPSLSNVNILSHSREAVSKYSVRKDEMNPRKRAREKERARKEAEKAEREEEKARLRRLRMEEMEEKVKKIKHAAGLRGKDTDITEWTELLEHDWDDDKWDRELEKRFGDDYYARGDADSDAEDGAGKKKVKKPKFDDDIDIKDLIPDFEDEDAVPDITLTDEEDGGVPVHGANGADVDMADADLEEDEDGGAPAAKKRKTKKDRLQEKAEKKAASRRDHRILSQLVESTLPTDAELATTSKIKQKEHIPFRYRETSPTTYGLTPLDILAASDAQLNTFVGLKKLTPFRDEERKARDRKKVSKKGRLREWRKEVYTEAGLEAPKGEAGGVNGERGGDVDGEGKKKKKKRKNKKGKVDGESGTAVEA